MPVTIGHELGIIPDAPADVLPQATDPCFLLHSGVTAMATYTRASDARAAFAAVPAVLSLVDAYFGEGGAKLICVPLTGTAPAFNLATALALITDKHGPGQVVAPEVVTTAPAATIAEWAATGRVLRYYVANAADAATVSTLAALGAALRAANGAGRFCSVEADTLVIPGTAGGSTREVTASIVKAALHARRDRETGNPNDSAAGARGRCRYALGIKAERSNTDRDTLADSGVNTFKTVALGGAPRAYGARTCANPATDPQWVAAGGSRTVMAYAARAENVREQVGMFMAVDGDGASLAALETALAAQAAELEAAGALYRRGTRHGYRIQCDMGNNTPADLAAGVVYVRTRIATGPHTEHILEQMIKLPITTEV